MSKEKFEDRKLTGRINIACKFDDGTTRFWEADKGYIVSRIVQIVKTFQADNYVLTLRQLHYQLVKANLIVNHTSAYKKLGDILDDCRYSGVIDWAAIEDRGRVPYLPYYADDLPDALDDIYNSYRLDRQRDQPNVVELWTEKDALSGILKRTTQKYHIRLVVNKGYSSSSAMYQAYERIVNNAYENRPTVILYFGDHDPSGLDMVRDIRERLLFMLENGDNSGIQIWDDYLQVIPIGLTMEQIKRHNLPPNPAKMTDSRSEGYIREYGKVCWEVDALDPAQLTAIVEANIADHIDMDRFEAVLEKEAADKKELKLFIDTKKSNDEDEYTPPTQTNFFIIIIIIKFII